MVDNETARLATLRSLFESAKHERRALKKSDGLAFQKLNAQLEYLLAELDPRPPRPHSHPARVD